MNPTKKMKHAFLLGAALTLGAGCASRAHVTESHGRSYKAALSAQVANPGAGENARPLPGLDAQEASIVARNYRRSLSSKGTPANQDAGGGMLILAPSQAAQPYTPPPSVPERP
jgi:type IV pilus biogenesis protein CpaD/CtpE